MYSISVPLLLLESIWKYLFIPSAVVILVYVTICRLCYSETTDKSYRSTPFISLFRCESLYFIIGTDIPLKTFGSHVHGVVDNDNHVTYLGSYTRFRLVNIVQRGDW